jgi:hypothetical protein
MASDFSSPETSWVSSSRKVFRPAARRPRGSQIAGVDEALHEEVRQLRATIHVYRDLVDRLMARETARRERL